MINIKHVMYSFVLILMFIICLLGIMTIESRTNRENNVQKTLKRATDNAVESILENQNYSVHSNKEFVATLTEMICDSLVSNDDRTTCKACGYSGTIDEFHHTVVEHNQEFTFKNKWALRCPHCGNTDTSKIKYDTTTKDDNLKLTIEIVDADYIKGLLSLNIIEEYTNPTGAIGTCEYATTVIYDEAKIYDSYTINYYDVNGLLIESYVVRAGDNFPQPSDSVKNQYHITGWFTNVGGSGHQFVVPDKVPLDSSTNNITQFEQYNATTKSLNLYGNYI